MTAQLQLLPLKQPDSKPDGIPLTIQARFEQFDRLNPQVRSKLTEMARELHSQGHKKIGIKMLFEVLRWHYMQEIGPVQTTEGYTLNNIFTAYYARAIMRSAPDLDGVFETRSLTSQ